VSDDEYEVAFLRYNFRWICVEYYLLRVQGIVKLLDQLDLIGRTSELARLFGIQFLEVLSRGSQVRKCCVSHYHRLCKDCCCLITATANADVVMVVEVDGLVSKRFKNLILLSSLPPSPPPSCNSGE
jgi:hypothetical protein